MRFMFCLVLVVLVFVALSSNFVFFFNDTATTEIYTYGHTLSLHDALPIWQWTWRPVWVRWQPWAWRRPGVPPEKRPAGSGPGRPRLGPGLRGRALGRTIRPRAWVASPAARPPPRRTRR